MNFSKVSPEYVQGMEMLVSVVQKLSHARKVETIVDIVRHAARELTGADGATFVLKEGDQCHYVDEDAIGPLWKGKKFPLSACISGWAMENRANAVIEDIYQDPRVPVDAYRPTFVKSLVMVPIRKDQPIGAIGNYWGRTRKPEPYEVQLLQSLADSTSIALENVQLFRNQQESLADARSARDEIARQLDLRDEFISIVAHELKTPLTPLMIKSRYLDKLISKGNFRNHPLEEDLNKYALVTQRQIGDLAKLIDDLLDVSKIRLDQFRLSLVSDVDLGILIREVVEQYQPLTQSKIETVLDPPLKGNWDPLRLSQLLRNLLSNAISYGLGKPISIRAFCKDGLVRLVVEDGGVGISLENQQRIFNRFERATSIKSFGGMGLGLFISKEIIEAHRGKIWVESRPNEGSQFFVELPIDPDNSLQKCA